MRKSGFLEGTIIATAAIVITKILGMLYVIPFYAMVGVQGSALYAYAYNIYIMFLDISSAGLPIAISKIIKEYNTLGMMDAKQRAYKLGKRVISFVSVAAFIILFIFAENIASLILGDLQGGNTIIDYVVTATKEADSTLPDNAVKVYLTSLNSGNESQVLEPTKISELQITSQNAAGAPDGQFVLLNSTFSQTEARNYRLRMWVASDYVLPDFSQTYKLRVNVYGSVVE